MPCHAYHQAAVVTPVGWPPRLALHHQGMQVLLERINIELLELLAIVKVRTQRVGLCIVLVQNVEI